MKIVKPIRKTVAQILRVAEPTEGHKARIRAMMSRKVSFRLDIANKSDPF